MRTRPASLVLGITLVTAACDQEPELLSRLASEPAGANCAHGGARLESGRDDDGDGQLADHEVDTVEYRCDGAVLVRTEVVPPGAGCPAGGTAVHVGHDTDGDGDLDDTEIEETTYACDPDTIWEGDLTITAGGEGDDQADHRDLRVVTGHLTFAGSGAVDLPALEVVAGDLRTGVNLGLTLPALRTVGGELGLGSVTACALPLLERVGGSIGIGGELRLPTFEAPALAVVGGDVSVVGNSVLSALRLPALTRVGGDLTLRSASALQTVALGALASVDGAVTVSFDGQLTALDDLDALTAVGQGIEIELNDRLERVELPALSTLGGDLRIDGDAVRAVDLRALVMAPRAIWISGEALESADLRALGQVGALSVAGNVGAFGLPAPGTLTDVDLSALQFVGDLALRGFATQRDLVLPALQRIDGQLFLEGLGALETVRMPALTDAQVVRITHGGQLRAVQFGASGDVEGVTMLSLTELDLGLATDLVLPAVVNGNTWLMGCTTPDLDVLGSLRRTETLHVRDNVGLVNLQGLRADLELAALDIQGNDQLTSLAGLAMVDHLTGGLEVWGNPALVDVTGLGNLTVIGGDLRVTNNATLPDLHGLGLRAVGGDFEIAANDQLSTLAGLASLDHVGGALTLSGGTVPAAEIAELRARLDRP